MRIILFISFFYFSGYCQPFLFGQSSHLRFTHYKTNDGLSQADVFNIFQDSRGFLWFSSYDGLNRFDGYQFRVYRPVTGDTSSILGERINGIIEDKSGKIWIGTNEALNEFDPLSGRFRHFIMTQADGRKVQGVYHPFYIDNDQELWFTYSGRSLGSLNLLTGIMTRYPFADGQLNEYTIAAVASAGLFKPVRYFYSSGTDGLHRIDLQSRTVSYFFSSHADNRAGEAQLIRQVMACNNQELWLAARNGLICFNPELEKYQYYDTLSNHQSISELSCLVKDRSGNIWCGSYGQGLYVFNTAERRFIHQYVRDLAQPETIANNAVTSLFVDRDDNIWIGIDLEGVDKANPDYEQLAHARVYPAGRRNDYTGSVWAIAEINQDELAICANHEDVFVYNKQTDQQSQVHLPQGFNGTTIFNLAADTEGNIWIAGEKGVLYSDDGLRSLRVLYKGKLLPDIQLCWYANRMYLGTGTGLLAMAVAGNAVLVDTIRELQGIHITAMATAYNGNLFIASTDKIIREMRPGRREPMMVGHFNFQVKSILYDRADTLWLGTTSGLVMWLAGTGKTTMYNELHGLPNHYVYAVLRGSDGLIWLSTNKGLSAVNPAIPSFNNFGLQEGVQSYEYNTHAAAAGKNGWLYFGGVKGFNYFRPEDIRTFAFQPRLLLLDFSVNGVSLPQTVFHQSNPPSFSHEQNDLQVEFAAIDYNRNYKIYYSYRFNGQDKWISIGNQRTISFANLQPGGYHLEIRAQLSGDQVSPHILHLDFSILPPFYRRAWFLILTGILLVGIVYGMYRYRIKQLLKVQAVRNRIAQDLHDEVGATLSGISMYGHLSKEQLNNGEIKEAAQSLQVIQRHSAEMVNKLNEIVWLVNPAHDGLPDLVQKLEEYSMEMAAPAHLKIHVLVKGDLQHAQLPLDHRRNLYLICKEAINNAVKYSDAGTLTLQFYLQGNELEVSVTDNGRGFDPSIKLKGNGLSNMRKRADSINAFLAVESSSDNGCRISLKMKIT